MLLLDCPFCGPRNETEFAHGGTARPRRPENPQEMSNADWIDHLIVPDNPMGPVREKWWHVRGCGQWFTVERDTRTHEIAGGAAEDHGR